MTQFRAMPSDFEEVIRHHQWAGLRRQGPYPLGALLVAAVMSFFYRPIALVALGVSLAWGFSLFLEWRSIRAVSLWRHVWEQEDVTIDIEDEGIRLANAKGWGFVRWDSGVTIRVHGSCFVIEDGGEDIAVIPKRVLNSTELLILQNRAASQIRSIHDGPDGAETCR